MTRVASLYLPHWPIDRLRRAERAHAPRPEAGRQTAIASLDAIGRLAAGERDSQCSVPATPGWRPGARWARSDREEEGGGDAPAGSRTAVEAAVAALPAHRRPPQRELGRVSEAAANPFAGAASLREMTRRTEAAEHPFARGARGGGGDTGQWLDPAMLDAAITALPAHQRPSFGELSRRSELAGHPFRPMSPDEHGSFAASFAGAPPLRFPGEDAPAKAARGIGTRAAALARAATMPPVNWPGEDARGRAEQRAARSPAKRPTSRDGHAGEANSIPAPSLATSLAQLAAMPSVAYPGEGPHPDNHGRSEPTAPSYGQGRFFQTGRTLGSLVARICPEEAEHDGPMGAASLLPPLVTVARDRGRVTIQACCPAALALGIAPGTALTQARAAFPALDVRVADPAGDAADLSRLALTLARRWTPVVAPAGADGLTLDVMGVAHLHGGEARMARRLVRLLARHGVTARVAVADTAGAAWALARYGRAAALPAAGRVRGRPQPGGNGRGAPDWSYDDTAVAGAGTGGEAVLIVPPGCHIEAIAPLPVAALRIEARARELLTRLGIDTIGQLTALPRGPLARRFGAGLLTRLDQASGRLPEPLDPVVPREPIVVRQPFAEPIATAEAIAHWLGVLVPRLAEALARAGLGARLVELVADRVDGVPQVIRVGLARPTRDPAHLLRLLARRIETIDPGYGIDALALHVRRADALGPEVLAPHLAEDAPPDLAPLIDALANRIGPARLWRCSPVESDVPERSVTGVAPLDPAPADPRAPAADDVRRLDERERDHPWHPRWPRPVRLLRRPERIDNVLAELPDRAPVRFTWRGRIHRVVRADGPERIAGEWWRRPGEHQAVRDYFHVEDEAGARFWLYRRGDGVRVETGDLTWFLHGQFG